MNNNLAVAYSARGEYAKAIPPLETAIRVAPGYWRAHVNLGIAEQGLGRPERARAAYLEAIRIAPGEVDPLYFYARFQADQGDLAGAVATLDAARRHRPGAGPARHGPGASTSLKLGRVDEARAAFQAALAIDPADAAAQGGFSGAVYAVGGAGLAHDRVPRVPVHRPRRRRPARAASRLCAWQRILQFSTVDGPPFPRGTTWSISSRTSEPQTAAAEATGHWHLPSSRFPTSRFTLAGTRGLPLLLLLDEQFQRRGEHLLVGRSGLHVATAPPWPSSAGP